MDVFHGVYKVICAHVISVASALWRWCCREYLEYAYALTTSWSLAGLKMNTWSTSQKLYADCKQQKREKCLLSVEYLGYTISEAGLQTSDSKKEVIVNAPAPRNVTELRSFLGLVNYYGKFLPNLAYVLLRKQQKWKWTTDQDNAFREVKALLQSSCVLVHFDDSLPLILATDASPYGIGAVLSHRMLNGDKRPVAFASRRNIPNLKGKLWPLSLESASTTNTRKFELQTDHNPLMYICNEKKTRFQQWHQDVYRVGHSLWGLTITLSIFRQEVITHQQMQ